MSLLLLAGLCGAAYTIAEIQSAVQQATGTLTTGSEGTDTVCLLPGCYIMVLSAGYDASSCARGLAVAGRRRKRSP